MKAILIEGYKKNTVQLVGVCETLTFEVSKRFLTLSFLFNMKKVLVFMLKQSLIWNDTEFTLYTKISKDGVVENEMEY